jgi:predicted Zn finger-like uncharacterized protein
MRIECPSCHFSADVDPAKLPPQGGNARCPKCAKVFFVAAPAPDEPISQATELPHQAVKVPCPKCGAEQESAESCECCGLIFEKYRAAQLRQEDAPEDHPAPATACAHDPASLSFGNGRNDIVRWVQEGRIDKENAGEAFRIAGTLPNRSQWRRFLEGFALWLGASFLAAAVIFFFAYNWRLLGRFTRFGIVELLLSAAVLAAWRIGVGKTAGKAALLVATVMVGALLALEGQTYQTGADPWELFATWAAFVLPWVALSRFAPLWLFWVALINLSAGLYYHAFAGLFGLLFGTQTLWWTLAALNTAALTAWEVAALRGVPWLRERWPQRLLATASAGYVTILAAWAVVDTSHRDTSPLHLTGYLAWVACAYAIYRYKIRDLYVLALGILSLIVVVSVFLSNGLLRHDSSGAFLLIGMVVLGMSAAGGWWLRNVAREVEA